MYTLKNRIQYAISVYRINELKIQREDEELYELIEPDHKKLVDEVIIRNSKF